MRIVAGTHRGRRITAPAGRGTRPTSDRVRESMFALVGAVDGLRVLDLFAGSGALGLEALSRGAGEVTFVDRDPDAAAAIRRNTGILDDTEPVRIVRDDWRRAVERERRRGAVFGLCLVDPPYSLLPRISQDLPTVLAPILDTRAIIVVEGAREHDAIAFPETSVVDRTDREYGGTRVSVIRIDQSR